MRWSDAIWGGVMHFGPLYLGADRTVVARLQYRVGGEHGVRALHISIYLYIYIYIYMRCDSEKLVIHGKCGFLR